MTRKSWLLYAVVSIAWGVPYALIRVALTGYPPAAIVLARVAVGAGVLIPLAAKRGGLRGAVKHWPWVLAFALIEMAGPWILLTSAEQHISSSLASLLISTVPFFSVPLAFLLGDKSVFHPRTLLGLVIGFLGVVTLVGIDAFGGEANPIWVGAMLLAALGYAVAPLIVDYKLKGVSSPAVAGLSMAMVAIVYAVPGGQGFAAAAAKPIPVAATIALLTLGLACTALAFTTFFRLIAEVGAARASTIVYPNLAIAFFLGIIFLKEPITIGFLVGVPMVIVGSWLASRRHT
jgi:drug/metabolite transporter (DMT)-like permease